MRNVFDLYIKDLTEQNKIKFATTPEELNFNRRDGYYGNISYCLQKKKYGPYTVEGIIEPSRVHPAVIKLQSGDTQIDKFARINICITDDITQKCIMNCSFDVECGGQRGDVAIARVSSRKEDGTGYIEDFGIRGSIFSDVQEEIDIDAQPELQRLIFIENIPGTKKKQCVAKTVSRQEFEKTIAGMPTPKQVRQIAKLLREKTVFHMSSEPNYGSKKNIILEEYPYVQEFQTPNFSPERVSQVPLENKHIFEQPVSTMEEMKH